MDPMRALASLEFVSARGLETADTGPKILANHVSGLQCGVRENKSVLIIDSLE